MRVVDFSFRSVTRARSSLHFESFIEVPEGAKNLTLNLEIDEAKEDMMNEICSLEVRSHSLKGVLGERAREAVGRLKNGRESSAKKGK